MDSKNYKHLDYVEIYPYKSHKKPRLTKLNIKKVCHSVNFLEYIQSKYLELYNTDSPQTLITEILSYTTETLGCVNSFLAINNSETTFKYYAMIMELGGVSLKSSNTDPDFTNNFKHVFSISSNNLLSRPLVLKKGVISNNFASDPRRSKNTPSVHPNIINYLGFPILKNGEILGIFGFSNKTEDFDSSDFKTLIPLHYFFSNFIELLNSGDKNMSVSQELKVNQQLIMLKDSFISSMSHEMRTPLNGMIGMARLLSESNLTEKQKEYTKVLTECGIQLVELVNDILDFSKVNSGHLKLNIQPFNIISTIKSAVDIVKQRALDKGLELITDIQPNFPPSLNGDSTRIKQIIINLLSNAIKFTGSSKVLGQENTENTNELLRSESSQGKIVLTARFFDLEEGSFHRKIVLTVKDTGIGIKKEDQEKIFTVFTKVGKTKNTSPGAGLGLAISKELAKLMNGDITLVSEYGIGSTFELEIILEDESDLIKKIEENKSIFTGKKLIIVDSSEEDRIFLTSMGMKWGFQTISFSTARETLNYVTNLADLKSSFDIAILETHLEGMNGIVLAQALKEKGYDQPIIGLTNEKNSVQGKEWFDDLQTKPLSKSELYNLLLKYTLNPSSTNIRMIKHQNKGKDLRILLAEDDYYNQIVFKDMLESLGFYNLKIVDNGKKCVDTLEKESFDLCFIDIKMPVMNGIDAVKIIKTFPSYPPVIAVSASVLDSDKSLYYKSGMDGYIPKPIDKDKLESVLNSFC